MWREATRRKPSNRSAKRSFAAAVSVSAVCFSPHEVCGHQGAASLPDGGHHFVAETRPRRRYWPVGRATGQYASGGPNLRLGTIRLWRIVAAARRRRGRLCGVIRTPPQYKVLWGGVFAAHVPPENRAALVRRKPPDNTIRRIVLLWRLTAAIRGSTGCRWPPLTLLMALSTYG